MCVLCNEIYFFYHINSYYLIKKCVCSLQNPAVGYYRQRPQSITVDIDPVDLVGNSIICTCYGHSDECDPETGICLVRETFVKRHKFIKLCKSTTIICVYKWANIDKLGNFTIINCPYFNFCWYFLLSLCLKCPHHYSHLVSLII